MRNNAKEKRYAAARALLPEIDREIAAGDINRANILLAKVTGLLHQPSRRSVDALLLAYFDGDEDGVKAWQKEWRARPHEPDVAQSG